MEIRKATEKELPMIMGLYGEAQQFMAQTGNPDQWGRAYPPEELVRQDIADGNCYICVEDEEIAAVFMYAVMEDPTYQVIVDGDWPNNRPYGVIHRVASSRKVRGAASFCMQWCFEQCGNLRCDTYMDNKIMQHVLEKNGFARCGTIFVRDHSPRIAYQKTE